MGFSVFCHCLMWPFNPFSFVLQLTTSKKGVKVRQQILQIEDRSCLTAIPFFISLVSSSKSPSGGSTFSATLLNILTVTYRMYY